MAKKKKKLKLFHKIFIGLFSGIAFGIILSAVGNENPIVVEILPWLGLLGDLFLRLIKMVIVPLVFFSIISGVSNLDEITKLRSVGIKSLLFFFGTGFLAIGIGIVMANIFKPGSGLNIAELGAEAIEIKELPTVFESILGIFPSNIFESLAQAEMLHIISFGIFIGAGLLIMGEKGKPLVELVDRLSDMMYNVVDIVIKFTPYGVFGLMAKAVATFGVGIFGPVFKFILVDYGANIFNVAVWYSLILYFVAKVNPLKFYKKAFQPWAIAFSTCSTAAAPQTGLIISIALLTGLGIPLDGIALIAGVYRIVDQIHTSTNALGDLVVATAVSSTENDLNRDVFNDKKAVGDEKLNLT